MLSYVFQNSRRFESMCLMIFESEGLNFLGGIWVLLDIL